MKYLVKVNYVYEDILNEETQEMESVKTSEIESYSPKYITDSRSLPRGGGFVFVEGVETKFPKVFKDEEDKLSIIEDEKPRQLKDAWATMDSDIASNSVPVFKTTNRESMLVFVDSFQLRILASEKYAPLGLKAELEVEGFSIDDELDTQEKIESYYKEVLFQLDMFRNQKIVDYLTLKDSLGF